MSHYEQFYPSAKMILLQDSIKLSAVVKVLILYYTMTTFDALEEKAF